MYIYVYKYIKKMPDQCLIIEKNDDNVYIARNTKKNSAERVFPGLNWGQIPHFRG